MLSAIDDNRLLWFGVLLMSGGLLFVATGGGLTGNEGYWVTEWQHRAFRTLCHQDPARSFYLNGRPMAVCTRCYGIYTAFALFWLAIPMLGPLVRKARTHLKPLLVGALLLNLADVVGNVLGFWENTLVSRFALGALMGMTAVLLLAGDFITLNTKPKRDLYGFDGT